MHEEYFPDKGKYVCSIFVKQAIVPGLLLMQFWPPSPARISWEGFANTSLIIIAGVLIVAFPHLSFTFIFDLS